MLKVFISHSSAQKPFVEEVANQLGRDYSIVDKYDFESGRKLLEEIDKSISVSNIFVLLLSNEGLNSDWVSHEINQVRPYIDDDRVFFLPFIIDFETEIKDPRIQPWIRKMLTNRYLNPIMLSRVIKGMIREYLWGNDDTADLKYRVFVGRDHELEEMLRKLYENTSQIRRAIIVSGIPHIGRKRLLREFLVSKIMNSRRPTYSPLEIRLTDTDSIEDFIRMLNEYTRSYQIDELYGLMASGKDKCRDLAVAILNEVASFQERVLINDDGCVVLSNGSLSDWFQSIVEDDHLVRQVSLLVASRFSLSQASKRAIHTIQSHQVQPLERLSIVTLFNVYASFIGIELGQEQVEYYVDAISGYPEQVFSIVDTLKDGGEHAVREDLPSIQCMFDEDHYTLFRIFEKDDNAQQLIVLMSQFEFVTTDILSVILDYDFDSILNRLRRYGLLDSFGVSGQYIQLNQSFADFIKRSRIPLDRKYSVKLRAYSEELIKETNLNSLDLASDLFRLKGMIADTRFTINTMYLLPSISLKVIIDEYRSLHYKNVVAIADRILYGYKRNNYESILYSIHYWLCLSLCRLKDSRLLDEIKYFHDKSNYTLNFLKGFYYRNLKDYPKALQFYNLALKNSSDHNAQYISKSEHEITVVKMKTGDYGGALSLARRSYEKFPWNSFHISSYFRCLVRMPDRNEEVLQELMAAMESSYDPHKEIVIGTMRAEYDFFYKNDLGGAIEEYRSIFRNYHDGFVNYAVDSFRDICERRNAEVMYQSVLKEFKLLHIDHLFFYIEDKENES